MTTDQLEQFSEALADRLTAATFVVAIRTGRRGAQRHSVARRCGGDIGANAARGD